MHKYHRGAASERGYMRILVVNDDGIRAEGICELAKMAAQLGEVWVVAPDNQCSAMSQRITVHADVVVKPVSFPVAGVKAYSVGGTPADCVKVALQQLMPKKPDITFSGINCGYNVGLDILYSGTVGAAMESLLNGVPAIAFSSETNSNYDVVEEHLLPIAEELLTKKLPVNELWNVNFPSCAAAELKGILWERVPAQEQFYLDHYERKAHEDGSFTLSAAGVPTTGAAEGTDIKAVLDRYISIGTIRNAVLNAMPLAQKR